jgi:hypothetical protein
VWFLIIDLLCLGSAWIPSTSHTNNDFRDYIYDSFSSNLSLSSLPTETALLNFQRQTTRYEIFDNQQQQQQYSNPVTR